MEMATRNHEIPEPRGPTAALPAETQRHKIGEVQALTRDDPCRQGDGAPPKSAHMTMSGSIEVPAEHVSILPVGNDLGLHALMATVFSSAASASLSVYFTRDPHPVGCLIAGAALAMGAVAYLVAFLFEHARLKKQVRGLHIRSLREKADRR